MNVSQTTLVSLFSFFIVTHAPLCLAAARTAAKKPAAATIERKASAETRSRFRDRMKGTRAWRSATLDTLIDITAAQEIAINGAVDAEVNRIYKTATPEEIAATEKLLVADNPDIRALAASLKIDINTMENVLDLSTLIDALQRRKAAEKKQSESAAATTSTEKSSDLAPVTKVLTKAAKKRAQKKRADVRKSAAAVSAETPS